MATVPQELLDLLDEAEKQLEEANDVAVFHAVQEQALADAVDAVEDSKEDAFEQLQESNASAGIAIAELRKHFGI